MSATCISNAFSVYSDDVHTSYVCKISIDCLCSYVLTASVPQDYNVAKFLKSSIRNGSVFRSQSSGLGSSVDDLPLTGSISYLEQNEISLPNQEVQNPGVTLTLFHSFTISLKNHLVN